MITPAKPLVRPCTSYECATGEGLPTHVHDVEHLCAVTSGRVEITVGDKKFGRGVGVYRLPANIPHSIAAIESSTVFYNIF